MSEVQIQESQIHEDGADRSYFTTIQNILIEILDPFAFKYYCVLKKIAGEKGKCFKSKENLASQVGCSTRMITELNDYLSKPFEALNGKPLIRVQLQKKPDGSYTSNLIHLVDIWHENCLVLSSGKEIPKTPRTKEKEEVNKSLPCEPCSPGVVNTVPQGGAPGALKQYPIKQDPIVVVKDNVPPTPQRGSKSLSSFRKNEGHCSSLHEKYKLTDEQTAAFFWLQEQQIDTEAKTLCWWAKEYSREKLEQVVLYAKKKNPKSLGRYIYSLLKKGVHILIDECERNRAWMLKAIQEFSLNAKVHQRYAVLENGTEIDFNTSHENFTKHMLTKLELFPA